MSTPSDATVIGYLGGTAPTGTQIDPLLEEVEVLENFALVTPGIYRSAFPKKRNLSFLKKLKLKSIL